MDGLNKILEEYDEEMEILERCVSSGLNVEVTPSDIKAYLHELFNLSLSGHNIKELWDQEVSGHRFQVCWDFVALGKILFQEPPPDQQYYTNQRFAKMQRQRRVNLHSTVGLSGMQSGVSILPK